MNTASTHSETAPVPSAVTIERLMVSQVGDIRAHAIQRSLVFPDGKARDAVSRAELALALAGLLFEDVQRRVPMARAYVEDSAHAGRRLTFDHGALRTVASDCGSLPSGAEAFARILEPLGYRRVGTYDLSKIHMTGFSYCHEDLPEAIPQYFVSELHPGRFSDDFQAAAARVVGESQDPLTLEAKDILARLSSAEEIAMGDARRVLPELFAAFDRQHKEPTLEDYETLLAESAEMAWISTEGNAFNHATDRVEDVFAVAEGQKALGRPIKKAVEVSRNGNVMQTAFRAAMTERLFRSAAGHMVVREVPGSFHEFITRKTLPSGKLDLTFDAGNATSIFKMTSGADSAAEHESA